MKKLRERGALHVVSSDLFHTFPFGLHPFIIIYYLFILQIKVIKIDQNALIRSNPIKKTPLGLCQSVHLKGCLLKRELAKKQNRGYNFSHVI